MSVVGCAPLLYRLRVRDEWSVTAEVVVDGERAGPEALNERVDAMASRLRGSSAVAVVAHPRLETLVTVLGAMRAQVPVVPISADAGPREREHILQDSAAQHLVDDTVITELPPYVGTTIPSGTAMVMYTSGTTGAPKGVPISGRAIEACLDGLYDAWAWTSADTLVHGLPLHHVHGLVLGVLGAVRCGSRLVHTGRPTPTAYAAAAGTLYFGVPTVWSRMSEDPSAARALAPARLLVSGSAALSPRVFTALADLCGQPPVERYGMTETLITVSARADEPRVMATVGRPLAGTSTRVVADGGQPLPPGSLGELQVQGPTVFTGYLGRIDATTASFTDDGWFRTGDAATIDSVGTHRLVGRLSTDLIKSGGFRIGAGEVEDALADYPGVHETAVVGIDDDDLGQRIVAFVVSEPIAAQSLIDHVAEQLSWHKRPREVVFVDALPRNAMGKVEKGILRDEYRPG